MNFASAQFNVIVFVPCGERIAEISHTARGYKPAILATRPHKNSGTQRPQKRAKILHQRSRHGERVIDIMIL
jgi:hypothetical protein